MARRSWPRRRKFKGFPHTRGDGPKAVEWGANELRISPHAWGWPESEDTMISKLMDFPTRVGMARKPSSENQKRNGFPHTRGDGPLRAMRGIFVRLISPHAWGWPAHANAAFTLEADFPTRVGMARAAEVPPPTNEGFPHTRGDGPMSAFIAKSSVSISPHAWGWPERLREQIHCKHDFPTRVGMARGGPAPPAASPRFPHTRGDGPP